MYGIKNWTCAIPTIKLIRKEPNHLHRVGQAVAHAQYDRPPMHGADTIKSITSILKYYLTTKHRHAVRGATIDVCEMFLTNKCMCTQILTNQPTCRYRTLHLIMLHYIKQWQWQWHAHRHGNGRSFYIKSISMNEMIWVQQFRYQCNRYWSPSYFMMINFIHIFT